MLLKRCFNCCYQQNLQCQILKRNVDADDSCPYFSSELCRCANCGTIIVGQPILVLSEDEPPKTRCICGNCAQQSGTCNLCKERSNCDFKTNPVQLPEMVQQQIRRGNQVMVATVKNPARIDATCKQNCKCWDDEFGCLKENGTCGKYALCIWDLIETGC